MADYEAWNVHHVEIDVSRWRASVTIHHMAGDKTVVEISADSFDTGGDGLAVEWKGAGFGDS